MFPVSVIVPTYQGGNKIIRLLDALTSQTHKAFEIIIVIDGSTDDTRLIIEKYIEKFTHLNIIEQSNKGRADARNNGVRNANGELLIFFDDDIRPENDCIERHVYCHSQLDNAIISGKIIEKPLNENIYDNDFLKFKHHLVKKWNKPFLENNNYKIDFKNYSFSSANLSLSKELFNKLQGFDERLNDSEDFDLSVRALQKGIDIYYIPKIIVTHYDFQTITQYINRRLEYKKQRNYLLNIHPEYKQIASNHFDQFNPSMLKIFFAFFFTYNSFWRILLNSFLVKNMLPEKFKFKIYDIIITSSIYRKNS